MQSDATVGLCASCLHARVMRSDRESVFYLCELSRSNLHFPKYPRLPVLVCSGYERSDNVGEAEADAHDGSEN
jgi:hypothetical protein